MSGREAWQEVKRQLDKQFGKGFGDKGKTKFGELWDEYDALLKKADAEVKSVLKARDAVSATGDAFQKVTEDLMASHERFMHYVKNAPTENKKMREEAVTFVEKAFRTALEKTRTSRFSVSHGITTAFQEDGKISSKFHMH